MQREIPSITPWASYIRDYFSFLSPASNHHHPPFLSSLVFTFLSLPHLFLPEATSTCQQVSERRGRGGGGRGWCNTSRKAQPDSSRFFFLSFLFLVSPIYFFPSSSFSHTPSLPPCAATVVLCFAPPSFLFLRNYRKLVP